MPSWTDNFDTPGYDWSSSAIQQIFWAALLERYYAYGDYGPSTTPPYPATPPTYLAGGPIVGTDVQAQLYWVTLQAFVHQMLVGFGAGSIPYPVWVIDGYGFVGQVSTLFSADADIVAASYTFASLRTALGYDPTGWRRKKPREITSKTATTDVDGNTVANGMYAWLNALATAGGGKLYKYDSTQSPPWQLCGQTGTQSPDLLDSASAVPNKCASGEIQVGDYIGGWLMNELRDMMRKMTRLAYYTPGTGALTQTVLKPGSYNNRQGSSPEIFFDSTWAAAQGDAQTAYTADGGVGEVGGIPAMCFSFGEGSPGAYLAQLSKGSCQLIQQIVGTGNTKNFVTTFYVGTSYPYEGELPPSYIPTFDANGQAWAVDGTYQLFQTFASGNVTPQTSNTVGDTAAGVFPNWVAMPASNLLVQGWWLRNVIVMCDFTVAGGFAYT